MEKKLENSTKIHSPKNLTQQQVHQKFLNETQVAELVGVSIQTLRNHRFLRRGLPYYKFYKRVLYSLDDVLQYLQERRVDPERGGGE